MRKHRIWYAFALVWLGFMLRSYNDLLSGLGGGGYLISHPRDNDISTKRLSRKFYLLLLRVSPYRPLRDLLLVFLELHSPPYRRYAVAFLF